MKRSTIGLGATLRLARAVVPHRSLVSSLVGLQMDKWFFHARNPRAADGVGGRIRQVSLRLTDVCNLRCTTCGQWGERGYLHGKSLPELRRHEVSLARYREVLHDLVQHGHRPNVYLWGGEPMLYDGTLDLVEEGARLGLPVSIATNGSRVAAGASRLVGAPLFLLQVSVDGPDAGVHNRLRPAFGKGDNFATITDAFATVREERQRQKSRLPLLASLTTISRGNMAHLVDIYEALRARVDMLVFYLGWWIDEESADAHTQDFERRFGFAPQLHRGWVGGWRPTDFRLLNQQLEEARARARRPGSPPLIVLPSISGEADLERYYTDHAARFGYNECVSIFQVVEVDSNGDVSPCRDYHDYVVGNIKTSTITELWNSEPYRKFRCSVQRDGLMPVCTRCCGLMGY